MEFNTKTITAVAGTTAAVTLPEAVGAVKSVSYMTEGTASFAPLTAVTAAPASATQVQFTGTPGSPSDTLTLDAAPATAGGLLIVEVIPVGAIGSNV